MKLRLSLARHLTRHTCRHSLPLDCYFMRLRPSVSFPALLLVAAWALGGMPLLSSAAGKPGAEKKTSKWVFSLLPRSFQTNPRVDFSVITEMTEEGKKIPPPTEEKPLYYFAQSAGFHGEGQGVQDYPPLELGKLEAQLSASLKINHYLPATDGHPPTIVLFYIWGVHNRLDPEMRDIGNANLLSRAQLVGGTKFAHELYQALVEWDAAGSPTGDITDPVHRFIERDDLTRQLMEQIFTDCYYIVVSAYEGAALAHGQRKLLWRTKIATPSQGIGLKETLPALVAGGANYYGKEMPTATVLDEQLHRGGHVDIGEAQVKEYIEPPPAEKKEPAKPR